MSRGHINLVPFFAGLQGCEPNEFRCNNKKCVSKAWRCDYDDDCGDNSDEENCQVSPGGVCQPNEYACRSGTQCIPKSYECDGELDCQDGSDESKCCKYFHVQPFNLLLPLN